MKGKKKEKITLELNFTGKVHCFVLFVLITDICESSRELNGFL